MTSIATLGIEVKSTGVQQAESDLNKLATAGAKAEKSTQSLGDSFKKVKPDSRAIREQKAALADLLHQIDPTVKALGRLDEQERKLAAFRKQGLVDSDTFRDYSTKIAATRTALSGFGTEANKAGLSAKQLAFATRGVPAQFTDIATALASGQRPLQVFLQQGGQLKDMFGGIGPAAKALGGYLLGLINPFTVAAAVIGGLVLVMKNAEDESAGFAQALIRTGGYAGRSTEQLRAMADQLNNISLISRGTAVDALTQVAQTGRFAGKSFDIVAEAAARMSAATGQSIQDTVSAFKQLTGDPVDGLLRLNDAEHFLTQAQLDRVQAMVDEGRQQEAVAEAVKLYGQHLDDVATKAASAMPEMSREWAILKDNIGGAASALGGYIVKLLDAIKTQGAFLNRLQRIANLASPIALTGSIATNWLTTDHGSQATGLSNGPTIRWRGDETDTVDSAAARARRQAQQDWARAVESNLTKQQKLESEIASIRKTGVAAGKSELEIDKQIAAARARAAENAPKGRKSGSAQADGGLSLLASIRQQIALNNAAADSEDKLSASEALHVRIVEQLKDGRLKTTAATRAAIEAALAELDASDKASKAAQAEAAAKKNLATITAELANAEENRRRANRADLLALSGGGKEELEQARRRLDIEREYATEVQQLHQRAASEHRDVLASEESALKDSLDRRLADETDYQAKRAALLADWRNGARAAIADFNSDAANIAQQTYTIVSDGINGLADAFTDLLTKGKADWKSYFDSIAREITAFVVKQQLSKLLKKFAPRLLGGSEGGDSAAALSGAAGALSASAAPLLAAAGALSASAAALAAAGIGGGGAGGSGSGWAGLFGSLFSSGSGDASGTGGWGSWAGALAAMFGGGRANGGPVQAGKIYEVNERGLPEMYVAGGRQFLLAPQSGKITQAARSGSPVLNQTIVVQGIMRDNTPLQIAQASAREQAKARRNA